MINSQFYKILKIKVIGFFLIIQINLAMLTIVQNQYLTVVVMAKGFFPYSLCNKSMSICASVAHGMAHCKQ